MNLENKNETSIYISAESTGSAFISKCISTSMGFYSWTGYGFYEPSDDIKFLHRSQRGVLHCNTLIILVSKIFSGYECKYILCTLTFLFKSIKK